MSAALVVVEFSGKHFGWKGRIAGRGGEELGGGVWRIIRGGVNLGFHNVAIGFFCCCKLR